MRLDRLVTMLLSRLTQPGVPKIPVLMYHSVSLNRLPISHPYFDTVTTPTVFRRHMELLHGAGYTVIRLDDLHDIVTSGKIPEKRLAVITFDDGYDDFYTSAFPVLQTFGFTATVFLPTAFIGAPGPGLEGLNHLTWAQVRELLAAGIEFGSHTVSHTRLVDEPEAEVARQLRESKERIEQELGVRVAGFAYPLRFPEENRRFVALVKRLLEENAYRYGVCTAIGTVAAGDDRFFMKRLPANSHDDDAFFLAKCAGAYDWVHGLQLQKKRIASWLQR